MKNSKTKMSAMLQLQALGAASALTHVRSTVHVLILDSAADVY